MADSFLVFLVGTICFLVFWIVASIIFYVITKRMTEDPRDKDLYARMAVCYVALAVGLMYLMWVGSYMHQKNPLILPDLKKPILEELLESERDDLILG